MTVYGFGFGKMDDGDYVITSRNDKDVFIVLSKYDLKILHQIIVDALEEEEPNNG